MNKNTLTWIFVLVLIVAGIAWLIVSPGKAGAYDGFADCLKEKGLLFYGAFWCPHCAEQKAEFGRSAKRLPYVECSTPDTKGQLQICIEKQIKGYPTWIFPDGTREEKVLSLEELSQKSSCQLPK